MNSMVYCIGFGQVSSAADDLENLSKALREGKSGIRQINGLDTRGYKCKYGGEITSFNSSGKLLAISEKAMLEAIEDAGIEIKDLYNNRRVGFVFGTSLGDTNEQERFYGSLKEYNKEQDDKASIIAYTASKLRSIIKVKGPSYTISNTCATGISVISVASQLIKDNSVDVCIAGCADILGKFIFSGMDSLKALSKNSVLKPFSEERDGVILGEGAGFLVLAADHYEKRKIRTAVEGYAITNDAVHISAPDRDAVGLMNAINQSLEMSGQRPEEIQCIFCSGNGTKYNDAMQAKAIAKIWPCKNHNIPVTTIKPVIGHTLAASGIIESIGVMLMMGEGYISPIGNEYQIDPQIDRISLQQKFEHRDIKRAILLSSGFSGVNGAVILRKG